MATATELSMVRLNTDEPTSDTYTDETIGDLIDENGISVASAIIWGQKAAKFASLVNTSEAGASRSFSDLHKHALSMSEFYTPKADGSTPVGGKARAKVHKIVRS